MYIAEVSEAQNPLEVMLWTWLNNNQRKTRVTDGRTQKDQALAKGRGLGIRIGMAYGVAAQLTVMRAQYCSKWGKFEVVTEGDVQSILRDSEMLFDEHEETQPVAGRTKEDREKDLKWRNDFLQKLLEDLTALAITESIKAQELERHQRAVLAKEEEPNEDDRIWLQEKLNTAQNLWSEIASLIPEDVKNDIENQS